VASAAKYWEQYKFSDVNISLQSMSPLGTASGALQFAHVPDPENAVLSATNNANNLAKLVRQSGSIILRPRDTKELRVDVGDTLFTHVTREKRFSSYGALIAVLRDQPASGDSVQFTMTFTCTVNFYRPTILMDTTFVEETIAARVTDHSHKDLLIKLTDYGFPDEVHLYFNKPLRFVVLKKNTSGTMYSVARSLTNLKMRRTGVPLIYHGAFDIGMEPDTQYQLHSDAVSLAKVQYEYQDIDEPE
jgi:hypothetical protein